MPYCESCGSQVSPTAKFCGNCGTARTQPTQNQPQPPNKPSSTPKRERLNYYSPPDPRYVTSAPLPIAGAKPPAYQAPPRQVQPSPVYQAPPVYQQTPIQPQPASAAAPMQHSGEVTIGVVPFRRMKSLGRYDAFAAVVTNQRMIFAQLTSEMISAAAQQARDQAKAEGKGFFGQWADQLRNTFGFTNRYLTMPPEAILNETPGNFALLNNTISEIKVHLKGQHQNDGPREFEAEIKSTQGTYKYRFNENSELTDILKRAYGDRVKMPFGYFSKTVNIKL